MKLWQERRVSHLLAELKSFRHMSVALCVLRASKHSWLSIVAWSLNDGGQKHTVMKRFASRSHFQALVVSGELVLHAKKRHVESVWSIYGDWLTSGELKMKWGRRRIVLSECLAALKNKWSVYGMQNAGGALRRTEVWTK